ncbi:MAG: hypothetical protein AAFU53_02595, partial [Cyanobacteria bacterium J06632_3]
YSRGSGQGIVWGSVLFKLVSVPFIVLLAVLTVHQMVSVHNYSAESESSQRNRNEFVGERLF